MKLTKENYVVAIGYVLFMALFYFVGATKARVTDFIAISLLAGFYVAGVWFVKKILAK